MDSQMERPHGHYRQEPRDAELRTGEDEHHHEKKSVPNKVKAKAKKIKDTLIHSHNHDQDHLHREEHVSHDHDLDEEEDADEDEEMVDEPEIHGGGSVFESALDRGTQLGVSGNSGTYDGRSSAEKKDSSGETRAKAADTTKIFVPGQEEDKGLKAAVGKTHSTREVPHALVNTLASGTPRIVEQTRSYDPIGSFAREQEAIRGQPEVHLVGTLGLEEDPHTPKDRPEASNYQTKEIDPTGTGGEEAGAAFIFRSFDKMHISNEPKPRTKTHDLSIFPIGSHDQFSPEPTPPIPITSQDSPESVSDTARDDAFNKPPKQGSYTEKITSATSVIADKAISAKNVIVSKLGYGEADSTKEHEGQEMGRAASAMEFGNKFAATVTEKLTPVYGEVAETGSTMISKVPGIRNEAEDKVKGQDKGVSVKNYIADKLRPSDEDKALSEVITEALHKQKTEKEKTDKPIGKVTESEEVKGRSGSTEENCGERVDPSSVRIPGSDVVDQVKGMVGSLFGKGAETRAVSGQRPLDASTTEGTSAFSTGASEEETGEKKLQSQKTE